MLAGNLNWEEEDAWPDFYALLEVDPAADSETLRRTISAAYARASALCDHRNLDTRFSSQLLTERVLPQCRRILLDSTLRHAYDHQYRLHFAGDAKAQSYHEFLSVLESRSSVEWPGDRWRDEDTGFLPKLRSQAIETMPKAARKPETIRDTEILEAEVVEVDSEANIIVPLVVPATRASMEKGEKMKGRHTEIRGGVTFDQLQTRSKTKTANSGRSLAIGALLGASAIGALGAAWAGGWLGSKNKAERAAPQIIAQRPPKTEPKPAAQTNKPPFQNVPPPEAGKPGSAQGKALMPLNTLAVNSDFEGGKLGAWQASNSHAYAEMPPGMPDPRSGDYVMTMWNSQPYAVTVEQTVRDLKPGTYSLSAWIRRSGGQSVGTMSVSDYGDKRRETSIPTTLNWTQIFIRDIKVSSGQCKIEFSTAAGGLKWIQVDAVEFHAS